MIRFSTAGESHGTALIALVEGMPSGVSLTPEMIDRDLARRQLGYGRGGRMKIEQDEAELISGVRFGTTIGSPIAIRIPNRDWENWRDEMSVEPKADRPEPITKPRPGHADYAGVLKTGQADIRSILERASARETAARVAAGAVAKALLAQFGMTVVSHVTAIGSAVSAEPQPGPQDIDRVDASPVRCLDASASKRMVEEIDIAGREGDTLGGIFEVIAYGCPPGLGEYASWGEKLDARMAAALMSVQAVKGVEIGEGFGLAGKPGSQAHDELFYGPDEGYNRRTNRAGGLEGGLTNGEPVLIRAVMKAIPTLGKPLQTVDMATKEASEAFKERADVCAVPAAAVVGEAMVAMVLADAVTRKFGGDCLEDMRAAWKQYAKRIGSM